MTVFGYVFEAVMAAFVAFGFWRTWRDMREDTTDGDEQ